jgi:hypothetical protein
MTKKVRRVRRNRSKIEASPPTQRQDETEEEQLMEEYAYVVKDLRRITILAAVMFALLILLNLLLR